MGLFSRWLGCIYIYSARKMSPRHIQKLAVMLNSFLSLFSYFYLAFYFIPFFFFFYSFPFFFICFALCCYMFVRSDSFFSCHPRRCCCSPFADGESLRAEVERIARSHAGLPLLLLVHKSSSAAFTRVIHTKRKVKKKVGYRFSFSCFASILLRERRKRDQHQKIIFF